MASANPQLLLMSGPSAVGKNTIIDELRLINADYRFVPTVTTRPPRAGEKDGVDYTFANLASFQKLVDEELLLEHAKVYGNMYGSPKKKAMEELATGRHAILRLDIQGARTIWNLLPKVALPIFIMPPSVDKILHRLEHRQADDTQAMRRRWESAPAEIVAYYTFPSRELVYNHDDGYRAAALEIDLIVNKRVKNTDTNALRELSNL